MILTTIKLRRGTAAQWAQLNPVLRDGEPGLETDTLKLKFGNGLSSWNQLQYASGGTSTPGSTGPAGRGISNATVNGNGELVLTYTDSTTQNLGSVRGPAGSAGLGVVTVVDGTEARPAGPVVIWIGGFTQPIAMGNNDVWLSAGEPPDTTVPTVPTNIFATSITTSGFMLTWTASTDNVGMGHYEARLNGGTPFTVTSPANITGLASSTLYNVELRAVDAANNPSAWSTVVPVTTSAPSTLKSMYGDSSPGTLNVFTDGGGSLRVGHNYYSQRALTIRGVRLWNPIAADSAQLNTDITFYAYLGDWTTYPAPNLLLNGTTPVQTKSFTDARVAGTWTEVLFDTPISIASISSGSTGFDFITLAYQFAGGNLYYHLALTENAPIASTQDAQVFWAEGAFPRSVTNLSGGANTNTNYGLDLLFEAAA